MKWINIINMTNVLFYVNDKDTSLFIDNIKYVFTKWENVLNPLLPSKKLSIANVMTVRLVTAFE